MTLERPTAFVSTGELPPPERVRALVDEAYDRFVSVDVGEPSRVYPALARAPRELFGICVVVGGSIGALRVAAKARRRPSSRHSDALSPSPW